MFRSILFLLIPLFLIAQDYAWPIKASRSLSATFCEYRSGHLHAGIDIKTWGEMEVPCLAIADGYIERILVGYHGYGRGLILRTHDDRVAVYGHLELFTADLESVVDSIQNADQKYWLRHRFAPDAYPVRKGQVIGFSGTSGTEHPHLHFEIHDTNGVVLNPQLFYSGIKDTRPPVLDEFLLLPASDSTRIDHSLFPSILDAGSTELSYLSGPTKLAFNGHDKADGTYNKYNIYSADLYLNDSLLFRREFDQFAGRLGDEIDEFYPGPRGKRRWRFMSLYHTDSSLATLMPNPEQSGVFQVTGLSRLRLRLADVDGNETWGEMMLAPRADDQWQLVSPDDGTLIIQRRYAPGDFQVFQFYSGANQFIPVLETRYGMDLTRWSLTPGDHESGIRALGTNGAVRWVLPPATQSWPELEASWRGHGSDYILQIRSDGPHVFPLQAKLVSPTASVSTELVAISDNAVESRHLDLETMALSHLLILDRGHGKIDTLKLEPFSIVGPGQSITKALELEGLKATVVNHGDRPGYFKADTAFHMHGKERLNGWQFQLLGDSLKVRHSMDLSEPDTTTGIFTPGKKRSLKRLSVPRNPTGIHFSSGSGRFFIFKDDEAPRLTLKSTARKSYRPGQRIVFILMDNTGTIPHPHRNLEATLDDDIFFPDYNPLRKEISFHVPQGLGAGVHHFRLSCHDQSGNLMDEVFSFRVRP